MKQSLYEHKKTVKVQNSVDLLNIVVLCRPVFLKLRPAEISDNYVDYSYYGLFMKEKLTIVF